MTRHGLITIVMAGLVAASSVLVTADGAFSYVEKGDALPHMRLSRHPSGNTDYLREDDGVTVFAFVKPNHERSRELLGRLDELAKEFAGRPVSWSLIVSDRSDGDSLAAIAAACPEATVLVDTGDRLYGAVGVPLVPVVGIADSVGHLLSYLPYRKVDYTRHIRAHLMQALGDLDADGLQAMLAASGRVRDSDEAKASRHLKLADMLLKRGKADKAKIQVEDALALVPDSRAAYDLLAEVLDALSEPEAAASARHRAESLARRNR